MMQQAGGMDVNVLMQRLKRLAMLDTTVFDEVRSDPNSTIPAIVVAVVATLLSGLGGWLWWVIADIPDSGKVFVQSALIGTILSIVLWAVFVAITYVMLTQVFRARADVNELIRVMGFATAPLALTLLMFIPGLDYGIALTSIALFFGTTVIATQTATDAPAGRVLVSCAAGFAVWAIILGLLTTANHGYAPGIFIFDRGADALRDFQSYLRSLSGLNF